jgi:nucleoside-diphosphate-sugar epimerase
VNTPTLAAFLADDFARLDASLLQRCAALNGQRLYLSGATGFFGKNLLALLAFLNVRGARFEVTALSRDPQRFLAQQPWCQALPWLDLRQGDARVPWPADGPHDLLLHAATDTHASAHLNPQAVFDDMLAVTRQALAFSAAHGVRRLLLTGSGAQYGAIPPHLANGVAETDTQACNPALPSSAYGEGKRVAELLAALHAQQQGCDVVNTRCFAFVGPGLPLDGHFAIGNFLRDALAGRPIALSSAGQAVRSYLYGADLAVWLLLLLLEAPGGACVNVGSDEGLRVLDLAHRVRDLVQPGLPVSAGPERPGEERSFYLPSISTARALGLDVWTPLDLAVRRSAQWHREQRP